MGTKISDYDVSKSVARLNPGLFGNRAPAAPAPMPISTGPVKQKTLVHEIKDVLKLNKTERDWYEKLKQGVLVGLYKQVGVQNVTLKIADRTRYTPDFYVILADDTQVMFEVKGFWRDDARVKIKVAARSFPQFKFIAVQKLKKKQGGGWKQEIINP